MMNFDVSQYLLDFFAVAPWHFEQESLHLFTEGKQIHSTHRGWRVKAPISSALKTNLNVTDFLSIDASIRTVHTKHPISASTQVNMAEIQHLYTLHDVDSL